MGETKLKARFGGWPNLIVRLDIWHFMRRLAVGCTTDAHQLYPTFMARMSACIFEWDAADVNKLREAKRAQLKEQGLMALTEKQLDRQIKKEELELHCRRKTRGEDQTIQLLDQLISELISDKGKDALARVRMPLVLLFWTPSECSTSGVFRRDMLSAFRTHLVWLCTHRLEPSPREEFNCRHCAVPEVLHLWSHSTVT